MKSKFWIRIGLSICTLVCIFAIVPAAYLELLNQIVFNYNAHTTILSALWIGGCVLGPLLAWIFHARGAQILPWVFLGVPLFVSIYVVVTTF